MIWHFDSIVRIVYEPEQLKKWDIVDFIFYSKIGRFSYKLYSSLTELEMELQKLFKLSPQDFIEVKMFFRTFRDVGDSSPFDDGYWNIFVTSILLCWDII